MKRPALALLLFAAASCGSPRRGPPAAPPVIAESDSESQGRVLFYQYCNPCHPGGEAGLGPALNNKPLVEPAIDLMVRQGLGAMPSFDEQEIDDAQLDAIVEYVQALRSAD